jgi:hypothetical protein
MWIFWHIFVWQLFGLFNPKIGLFSQSSCHTGCYWICKNKICPFSLNISFFFLFLKPFQKTFISKRKLQSPLVRSKRKKKKSILFQFGGGREPGWGGPRETPQRKLSHIYKYDLSMFLQASIKSDTSSIWLFSYNFIIWRRSRRRRQARSVCLWTGLTYDNTFTRVQLIIAFPEWYSVKLNLWFLRSYKDKFTTFQWVYLTNFRFF